MPGFHPVYPVHQCSKSQPAATARGHACMPAEAPPNRGTLQSITHPIAERFQPEQVILFGSCARGDEDRNCDLDLLVVLRPGQEPPRCGNRIRRAIAERFVLPVDLLIRSHEAFATYRPNPNSILSRMLEDAEVLYGRRAA